MLKLTVKYQLLCLLRVYTPITVSEYKTFVDNVNDVLQRVGQWYVQSCWEISMFTSEQTRKHGKVNIVGEH